MTQGSVGHVYSQQKLQRPRQLQEGQHWEGGGDGQKELNSIPRRDTGVEAPGPSETPSFVSFSVV